MNFFPSREVLRRRADIALVAIFFALIWLPAADSLLHLDVDKPTYENRQPAAFPQFIPTLAGARTFSAGVEAYFNDHFGFRGRLVRLERHLKWQFFHDAISQSRSVIVGRNGWLFYRTGMTLEDIRGARPFSEAELEDWRRLLTGRRDWLAARGIRYLFVIPPDKHSVYPEHLPSWIKVARRSERRIGQLVEYMRRHSDVPVLDLHDTMLAAKTRGIIYRQTDTHWNSIGAFAASDEIVRTTAGLGVPARPLDRAAFEFAPAEMPRGDLSGMLGTGGRFEDRGDFNGIRVPPMQTFHIRADAEILPKKWAPSAEPRISEYAAASAKAVIFHDSFIQACMPFLGESFGRIVYVWQQNLDKRIFEKEKPDIVINEMLERMIICRDPNELMKLDELPDVQLLGQ